MKKNITRAAAETKKKAHPNPELHTQRLLHELQTRQLELEAQNKSLIQARAETESAYLQYTNLYDFAPVGYFTLARDGTICQTNLAGANLLGVEHNELTQYHLDAFVSDESKPAYKDFLAKLLSGSGKETCELALGKKEGNPLWARLEATCFEGGDVCRAMLTDITERKQIEQALRESENRFRTTLQEVQTIAVQGYAADGTTQYWNAASERLYGYSAQEAIGKNLLELIVPPEMRDSVKRAIQQMVDTGQPIPSEELSLMRKDGSRAIVYSSHAIVSAPGAAPELFCMDVDLTERKRTASLLQARVRISEFSDSHTLNELLQNILDEAEILTSSQVGFSHFVRADQKTLELQMWSTNTLKHMCTAEGKGEHYPIDQAGIWADCATTRTPVVHNDYPNIAHRTELPAGHAQILRELVVPVIRNEQVVMIMGVGNKLTNYDNNDVEAISQIANLAWDIIQRKQAENALKSSEKKYRLLHESMIDGFVSVNMDGNFLEYNEIYRNMLGYSEAEFAQLSYLNITPEKWLPIEENIVETQILKRGYSDVYEKEYIRKDGTIFPVELHTVLLRDEQGNPTGMWAIVRDISERKQAETNLRASELKFRALAENIPSVIYQCRNDQRYTFLYLNNAIEELTGYPPKAFVEDGLSFLDLYHPNDIPNIRIPGAQQPDINRGSFHITYRILHKSGEWRWVDEWGIGVSDDQGALLYLEGILLDITERKRAEEALSESNELFSLFMSNSPIYTFIKSVTPTESRVLQVSDNFHEITGITGQNMLGKTMQELFPPDLAATMTSDDWTVVANGNILKVNENFNGRHYTSIKFPIVKRDKILLAGYTIDITEQVLAETALQNSELFIKDVLNSLTAHIAVLNKQGEIVTVNETWKKFGRENDSLDPEGFLGVNYLSVCKAAIEQGDPIAWQVDRSIRAVLAGDQTPFSTEYPCDSPTEQRWFTVTVLPQHRFRQGAIIIHQDITERKRAEQTLATMNIALQTALIREQQLAHTDELTGVNNRRYLYELAEREFETATRYKQPLSVIMFDIDHFKKVNDTYGHAAGDQILQRVTQVASSELRSTDVIGRYGGEEFVIILPMTNVQQAFPLAERIRAGVGAIRVPTEKGEASVTLSIGIVEMMHGTNNRSIENLIGYADKVMYAAKQAGRNCTKLSVQGMDIDNENFALREK